MSDLIGRVHFNATLDGKAMDRDAEKVGRSAGQKAAKGYDEEWSRNFEQTLTKSGREAYKRWQKSGGESGGIYGREFSRRMGIQLKEAEKIFAGLRLDADFLDRWGKQFGDAEVAAGELQDRITLLRDNNEITAKQFDASRRQVDAWAKAQRDASEEAQRFADENERVAASMASLQSELESQVKAREGVIRVWQEHNDAVAASVTTDNASISRMEKLNDRINTTVTSVHGLNKSWSDLSHNQKQWTMIIAAVAAGMQDIAVLGSAAGAGIIALGGAVTGGIAGIGSLVAVIVSLNKDLEELPDHLRPVAAEFQRFTGVFGEMRNVVATGAFEQMEGSFDRLGDTFRALTPELAVLGTSTGKLIDEFTRATAPGTRAFNEIQKAMANAIPTSESLARSTGKFGEALLRSFNEAQPLVEDFTDWISRLANQFDDFTRSDSFGVWISNSQETFRSFGALLDAVGRSLNDLVTPGAIARTQDFMDNLTAFMPSLTTMLDVLGRFDAFGLAAELLNDVGDALAPLAGPIAELAESLNEIGHVLVDVVASAVKTLATVAVPVVEVLNDIADALPPEFWGVMASGVISVVTAIGIVRGAQGFAGLVNTMRGVSTEADKTVSKLGRIGGAAGAIGTGVFAVAALSNALEQLHRATTKIDDRARNAVASNQSLSDAYEDLGKSAFGASYGLNDASGALDMLSTVGTGMDKFFGTFAATFSDTGRQASQLAATLDELDAPLSRIAQQNLPEATKQFASYAAELGATDAQTMNMINSMEEFKGVLISAAEAQGIAATDANLLALAMGEMSLATDSAALSTAEQEAILAALEGRAYTAGTSVDELSEKIRGFGSAALSTRDAEREFQSAIDDVTASVIANGTSLDVNEAQGRANQAALDDIAKSALDLSGSILEQTGSQEQATGAMQRGRNELILALKQFGITGQAAEDYANELGLIPENIYTAAHLDDAAARWRVDKFISDYDGRVIRLRISTDGSSMHIGDNVAGFASGGTLYGPEYILAGEAGPEAIVPLDRPLNQVDESVRWLSAIAQNKTAHMAGGGVVGQSGRQNIVESGAIVVQEAGDGRATANNVLQRLVESLR